MNIAEEHGHYCLQLRDRLVPLATIDPPSGVTVTYMRVFTDPEFARVFLNDLGADGDAFVAAIPEADIIFADDVPPALL